jgi:hypothetical protein
MRRTVSQMLPAFALTVAFAFGYLIATVHAHDVRLDEAFQALQKAQALVEAAQTGGAPPQTQQQFDHHRERALKFIIRAMEEVVRTAEVADGQ